MVFFDGQIKRFFSLADAFDGKKYNYNAQNSWKDLGESHIIMQRDSAYELDGIGFNLIASAQNDITGETVLIGDDIAQIKSARRFARVSLIYIDETNDEQELYNLIRKIEFVKYHYFPEGYMIRTSSRENKEVVRISKKAVAAGISFEKVGNLLSARFLENKSVKGVKNYFITDGSFDFKSLNDIAEKSGEITNALNHIMQNVKLDCSACNLKPICDEVEGMRELHFKNSGMK